MPTRSFMAGTNNSRGNASEVVGGAGRRGIRARQCLAPTLCPNVGATHWVAPGHSRQRACSWLGQTIREACLGSGGRRGASRDKGEAVPRPYIVSQRRGDPLGRPRSFTPTRLFMAGTNKSRGNASEVVGGAGRRGIRARQCLAPTLCPNVGATHWVALGHSCQRACSWLGQTIREAMPRKWWAARGVAG